MALTKSTSHIESIVEDIVEQFVKRKIVGACLLSSAILAELTGGKVIQGYVISDELRTFFRHYWTVVNSNVYDITYLIRQQLSPSNFTLRLSEVKPPNAYTYYSMHNLSELNELEAGYSDYLKNKYLKKSPGWVRRYLRCKNH